jgi:chromosomal replication initiation ATPase DnaA
MRNTTKINIHENQLSLFSAPDKAKEKIETKVIIQKKKAPKKRIQKSVVLTSLSSPLKKSHLSLESFYKSTSNEHLFKLIDLIQKKESFFGVIQGGHGVGKSYFLQCLYNDLRREQATHFINSLSLAEKYLASKNTYKLSILSELYREMSGVIMIDDIQDLGPCTDLQAWFSDILHYWVKEKRIVIISTDLSFNDKLVDKLKARLSMAMSFNLPSFDEELGKKLLLARLPKVDLQKTPLPKNYFQLENIIQKEKFGEKQDQFALPRPKKVLNKIAKILIKYFNIAEEDLRKSTRDIFILGCKRKIIVALKKQSFTLKEIAQYFKNDHTTILYHLQKHEEEKVNNRELTQEITLLTELINSKLNL